MVMYSRLKPGPIGRAISNKVIQSIECVKFMGIHIDNKFSFDQHISSLYQLAPEQCNALEQIAKFLIKESK